MIRTIKERYSHDPVFARLTDTLYHMLSMCEFTPTETREALYLAQLKFEENSPRKSIVGIDASESPDLARLRDCLEKKS